VARKQSIYLSVYKTLENYIKFASRAQLPGASTLGVCKSMKVFVVNVDVVDISTGFTTPHLESTREENWRRN